MSRTMFGALVLALATSVPAAAQEPLLVGDICDYVAIAPQGSTTWTVVVDGGPLAAADVAFVAPDPLQWVVDNPVSVTLTCSVHIGWWADHSSPAAASVSATGPSVAVLPPTAIELEISEFDSITLCTSASVTDRDGQTYDRYWDAQSTEFTDDPSAGCNAACTLEFPPRGEGACGPGVFDLYDYVLESDPWDIVDPYLLDPTVCPVLAQAVPPEGDVAGVWDCPPYGT